jgi:hypothetical protein
LTAKLALKPVVDDRMVGLSLHLNSDPDQCGYSLPFMSRRDGIPWDKGRAGVARNHHPLLHLRYSLPFKGRAGVGMGQTTCAA